MYSSFFAYWLPLSFENWSMRIRNQWVSKLNEMDFQGFHFPTLGIWKAGDGLHASDVLLAPTNLQSILYPSPPSVPLEAESYRLLPELPHRLPDGLSQWEAPAGAGEWEERLSYSFPAASLR